MDKATELSEKKIQLEKLRKQQELEYNELIKLQKAKDLKRQKALIIPQNQVSLMSFLVEGKSKAEIMKHFSTMTLEKSIIGKDLKSLRKLSLEYTEDKVISGMSLLIRDTSTAFEKTMSVEKAKDLAVEMFYSEYYYLSMEDLFIILKECKDYDLVFTQSSFRKRLRIYAEKRSTAAENRNYNQYLSTKFSRPHILISEAAQTMQKIKVELYKKKMTDERT